MYLAAEIVNILYTQYFKTVTRQGHQDPKLLHRINHSFMCLVATALRHSLKACRTEVHDEKVPEFKYETAYCKF